MHGAVFPPPIPIRTGGRAILSPQPPSRNKFSKAVLSYSNTSASGVGGTPATAYNLPALRSPVTTPGRPPAKVAVPPWIGAATTTLFMTCPLNSYRHSNLMGKVGILLPDGNVPKRKNQRATSPIRRPLHHPSTKGNVPIFGFAEESSAHRLPAAPAWRVRPSQPSCPGLPRNKKRQAPER